MPKLIDHAAREIELAEATWRVALRDGAPAVSVRSVAAEAGLATASLRRAFPTQAALLAFSLDLVRRRVGERVAALPATGNARERLEAALWETLPLDAERRVESEVFLVIGSAALSTPAAQAVYGEVLDALGELCRRGLAAMVADGLSDADLDVTLEARRLHALADGLVLHLIRQPAGTPTSWATRVLAHHLDALTARS